jgi:hypothetical protein
MTSMSPAQVRNRNHPSQHLPFASQCRRPWQNERRPPQPPCAISACYQIERGARHHLQPFLLPLYKPPTNPSALTLAFQLPPHRPKHTPKPPHTQSTYQRQLLQLRRLAENATQVLYPVVYNVVITLQSPTTTQSSYTCLIQSSFPCPSCQHHPLPYTSHNFLHATPPSLNTLTVSRTCHCLFCGSAGWTGRSRRGELVSFPDGYRL